MGLAELEKRLKALDTSQPAGTGLKIVKAGLREGAKVIQAESKALAPKRSGKLAESIRVKAGRKSKKRTTTSMLITTSSKDKAFTDDQYYGGFQNFGYEKVNTYRGARGRIYSVKRGAGPTTKVPGLHFMEKAAKAATSAAIEKMAETIGKKIDNLFKKTSKQKDQ